MLNGCIYIACALAIVYGLGAIAKDIAYGFELRRMEKDGILDSAKIAQLIARTERMKKHDSL